jgi:hypothetical protein
MKTLADPKCQQEIRTRVQALRPEMPRKWGKMSASQIVCHLADGFRMYMGLRPVADDSNPLMRTAVKWIAIWAPIPWPHGFRTVPELDQDCAGTAPSEFRQDVDELLRLMNRMTARPKDFDWQAHPHFGQLSEPEWMRLGYLHVNHHLRQFGC